MSHMKTVSIIYKKNKPTNPTFAKTGVTKLHKGDTIMIELEDFPTGSTIEKIEFNHNRVISGKNSKDTESLLGSWTCKGGNTKKLREYYICAVGSKNQVIIVDTEDNDDDVRYWYSASGKVKVKDTEMTWSIDPELINKGRR